MSDHQLSHLDSEGRARMVDVSAKVDTTRTAIAAGEMHTTAEVVRLVQADDLPKADVLATARIAGIQGAKKTSELIPLCHPIPLSSVNIAFDFTETTITIEATAKTKGPTGVEMEALTAVAIAGLTLHDMVKAVDPGAVLTDIRLVSKTGGKRGHWTREGSSFANNDRSATVIVSSTGAAQGTRDDTTGPVIASWMAGHYFAVNPVAICADADIAKVLSAAVAQQPALIITTGGTGASPTDRTPEATSALLDRPLPGVAELIRQKGTAKFPLAALSRGIAGLAGRTVIVNLPGSPGGVKDGLAVLDELLDHLLAQVAGGGQHESTGGSK
ncbi:bifunctional molybdenum cofactor biosynthesis protein MoaC/MoaB [Smaragdicoccus niigatensis]|uniref:bifunctional molybdenum cofactor biosynthesis protein MoaC/MoaB n=1 Tax=Smaragdicoccus niigatensis TaxID=359359 RepID=UPI0003655908|nr:bifunctional molybdenum cofactor biosynthesis protein MoaC/MoaB [Smaragdicoccus niigatensis]